MRVSKKQLYEINIWPGFVDVLGTLLIVTIFTVLISTVTQIYFNDQLEIKRGEISSLDVKINENNVRNGFFELDWNKYFIEQLLKEGYGVEGDPEEEVVDRWFRDIVYNMLAEEGMDTNRNAGYINVVPISKGKSEVS